MYMGKKSISRRKLWQKEAGARRVAVRKGGQHLFLQITGQILQVGPARLATRQGVAETMDHQEVKMAKEMTSKDANRIQSTEVKKNDGKVIKDSFAARAQRAAEKNKK